MHTCPHSNQVLCLHCYLLSSSSPTRRQPRVTSAGELAKIVNVFIIILSSHVFICILIIAYFCSKHLQLFQAKAIAAKKIWQHFSNKQNIQVKINKSTRRSILSLLRSWSELKRFQFHFQFRVSLKKLFVIIGNKKRSLKLGSLLSLVFCRDQLLLTSAKINLQVSFNKMLVTNHH